MIAYFATDGNYGNAEDLVKVDTTDWTEEEWEIIENTRECDRPAIAVQLATQENENQLSLFDLDSASA